MSWQRGQCGDGSAKRTVRALPGMTAAVLTATQKPLVEQAMKQGFAKLSEALQQVPGDIDWQAFTQGVNRYQGLEARVARVEYPVLGNRGRVTLRDAGGNGPMVVLVPSMVNRGYVLDLHPEFSLVAYLRKAGFTVVLVDWGEPGVEEAGVFDLEEMIGNRLVPLLREAAELNGGPVGMFGYCMGAVLAVAAASLLGEGVIGKLALGAMPWDFSQTASAQHMAGAKGVLEPWVAAQGIVPGDAMQHYFWALDPWSGIRRLMAYGQEFDPARLEHMTALEDWLNDSMGLDSPVAAEMLFGWYVENKPLNKNWKIGGELIDPERLAMPLWVAVTQNDVLVPTASSLPFLAQTRGAQMVMAQTGHVGLVCGRKAESQFYQPLAHWLQG